MIVNYIIKTGDSSLSGCAGSVSKNNQLAGYLENVYMLNETDRTGLNTMLGALNSQTLLERTPSSYILENLETAYSGDGDFFSKTGEFSNLYFSNLTFENWAVRELYYDIRSGAEGAHGESNDTGTMQSSFRSDLAAKLPNYTGAGLYDLDFFLNGQKMYTGLSGSYRISGDQFYYLDNITGQIFAIPKKTMILEGTGLEHDVYGHKFIEKNTNIYLNGMEASPDSWMELSTGVTMIETGKSSKLFEEEGATISINL